jgi:glycosyltransferase involved in cell wall biosynthesis
MCGETAGHAPPILVAGDLLRRLAPNASPGAPDFRDVREMKPKVLVGIATHNRAAIIPKAITSALAQRGYALRVSVVDDGSTDTTPELAAKFPMVEWIRWSSARGYMAARNHWMTSATEDYFVSLDDDAWFLEGDEIAVAVEFLETNPNVAAAAFSILAPDSPNPTPRAAPRRTATFIGCGHVLRLAAVHSVGVYEPTAETYGGE